MLPRLDRAPPARADGSLASPLSKCASVDGRQAHRCENCKVQFAFPKLPTCRLSRKSQTSLGLQRGRRTAVDWRWEHNLRTGGGNNFREGAMVPASELWPGGMETCTFGASRRHSALLSRTPERTPAACTSATLVDRSAMYFTYDIGYCPGAVSGFIKRSFTYSESLCVCVRRFGRAFIFLWIVCACARAAVADA